MLHVLPDNGERREVLIPNRLRGTRAQPVEEEVDRLDTVGARIDAGQFLAEVFGAHVVACARPFGYGVDIEVVVEPVPRRLSGGVDDLGDAQFPGGFHNVVGAAGVDVKAERWAVANDGEVDDGVHAAAGVKDLLVRGDVQGQDVSAMRMGDDVGEEQVVIRLEARGDVGADIAAGSEDEDFLPCHFANYLRSIVLTCHLAACLGALAQTGRALVSTP